MWFTRWTDGITLVFVFALIRSGAGCTRDNKEDKRRQLKNKESQADKKQSKLGHQRRYFINGICTPL
jgi:hypothetical protein